MRLSFILLTMTFGFGAIADVPCPVGNFSTAYFGRGEVGQALDGRFRIRLDGTVGNSYDPGFGVTYHSNVPALTRTNTFNTPNGSGAFKAQPVIDRDLCPGQEVTIECTYWRSPQQSICTLSVF